MDPRRSLTATLVWLIVALAATFSICAAVLVGRLARADILQQHVRRLVLETGQLSSDLSAALTARIDALRATPTAGGLPQLFALLQRDYPHLAWVAASDAAGTIVAGGGPFKVGESVAQAPWFTAAQRQPWLGYLATSPRPVFGDVAIAVRDEQSRLLGIVTAHLDGRRPTGRPVRLIDDPDPRAAAQAVVLDHDGVVRLGPAALVGKPWSGSGPYGDAADGAAPDAAAFEAGAPQFQRLPDGQRVLVARAPAAAGNMNPLDWRVQLSEPNARVYQRSDALQVRILWVSMGLGLCTSLLGAWGARHVTRKLRGLTQSIGVAGASHVARIDIPPGVDEVAQLGRAFAALLVSLERERSELKSLSEELERRVEVRTREVERLAEESRYSAMVRERLKIARDLHDTLAHSMMAMLSEIRFLRKLQLRDPAAVPKELERAEAVAHQGLKEARGAITQMRGNAARDTGLGAALAAAFEQFKNHTGLSGDYSADPAAALFGDERADTLLRMAQEALRNVQQHSQATQVTMRLHSCGDDEVQLLVEDNGIGFDPEALPSGHYGLLGLAEQAELIGAVLHIDSAANRGTRLSIRLRIAPMSFGARTPPEIA